MFSAIPKLCFVDMIVLIITGFLLSVSLASGDDSLNAIRKKPLTIDFDDVAGDRNKKPVLKQSELRIAVAAMISPKYTYKYYVELLSLIGERMNRPVKFVQKKTYSEVNEMLKQKELDLAFVCSGPYVSGKREFGAEILAVPVCHGQTVYHSYFIVAAQSGIKSFDDLKGKVFAFTDPLSNTGYMVPVYYLAKRNEIPEDFFNQTFYTHSHDNSIRAVANGLADGAGVDSLIYDFMKRTDPELIQKTRIVEKSPPYGIPPVVTLPSMEPGMKARLRQIFYSIHDDPIGKKLLANLQIDRFEEGKDADYDTVRQLQNFLKTRQE